MCVVHPNVFFSPDLKLKKACMLYMPAWYTHCFMVYFPYTWIINRTSLSGGPACWGAKSWKDDAPHALSSESKQLLTFYQTTKFVQIESICRRQFKCGSKIEICLGKGREHCGKKRKGWLPAFSSFLTIFSKRFFLRDVKSWDYVVTSYPLPDDKIHTD